MGAHLLLVLHQDGRGGPTSPRSDSTKLSAAVKYWNQVDVASEVLARRAVRRVVGLLHGRPTTRTRSATSHTLQSAVFPELLSIRKPSVAQGGHLLLELQLRGGHPPSSRSSTRSNTPIKGAAGEGAQGATKGRKQGRGRFFKFLLQGSRRWRQSGRGAFARFVEETRLEADRQLHATSNYVKLLERGRQATSKTRSPPTFPEARASDKRSADALKVAARHWARCRQAGELGALALPNATSTSETSTASDGEEDLDRNINGRRKTEIVGREDFDGPGRSRPKSKDSSVDVKHRTKSTCLWPSTVSNGRDEATAFYSPGGLLFPRLWEVIGNELHKERS